MEEQMPWIVCRDEKNCCLLAKDNNAFYIIEVGKSLNRELEEWLQVQGVSEDLLKELQLSFAYISKKDIKGVAFTGCDAGDEVYLHLQSEKWKLILEMDYDQLWMDAFFNNQPRITVPKRKNPRWRKERLNKETFEKLKLVAPCFLSLGMVSGVGWIITRHRFFFTCSLVLCAAQLALVLSFPVYFTIFLPKGKKGQNVWELGTSIFCTAIWLLFGVLADTYDSSAFRWVIPLGIGGGILIYWCVRDFHGQPWAFISCLWVCFAFTSVIAEHVNVVYDNTPGESWVIEVEKLHTSSGRRYRSYYCTVTLPDGNEQVISVTKELYRALEEGDFVRVEQNIGALGMEYSEVHLLD